MSSSDEDEDEENFLSTVSYIGNVWLEILMVATIAKDLDFEKWLGLSEKLSELTEICHCPTHIRMGVFGLCHVLCDRTSLTKTKTGLIMNFIH